MTFSGEKTTQPEKSAAVIIRDIRLYLLDVVDTQAEKSRLQKEIDRLSNGIRGAEAKLSNDNFVSRAPEEVVLREKQRLVEMKRELESAEEAFRKLS